ncbi:DUF3068 domain-containing protein [Blastococcus sp. CCUG 61487]|uniref:DUF3068 domain-containing protein n=1 Tax=Blastococcus sp. CCUG 61487 TaxID=1840703 RepID=UPI0010C098CC|nr:DUF3068 domain-containing protein [Blastococcus sp. CCUG 61487]TKJ24808.1 hypothetical protein A6V29_04480 [Blastococcus sp. CCUG 61487]
MRARVVGPAVIGLGCLALVVAVAGSGVIPLTPVDLRLDESFEIEARGAGVTYLDPVTLTSVTSDEASLSVRVRGDEDTGDAGDDVAVWEYRTTVDDADGTLISTGTTVACLDRRSAEAVDCVAESIDGERVDVTGLAVVFPADTEQRDYALWDSTVRQSFPARFVGTESLDGTQVYRFEQEVPVTVISSVTVPGELLGAPGSELGASVAHSAARTLLVEPISGVVVSAEESPVTVLPGPEGRPGATLLAGTFTWTDESIADAVDRAEEIRAERSQLREVGRWTAGGVGAALLALGVLLTIRRRPAGTDHVQDDEPARVAVPSA